MTGEPGFGNNGIACENHVAGLSPRFGLVIYVTGLTVALVATINACLRVGISVTLMHYNRDTGSYYPQDVRFPG